MEGEKAELESITSAALVRGADFGGHLPDKISGEVGRRSTRERWPQ
jgi:hypothetical protein